MSDTFDHEGDAWASLDWEDDPDEESTWRPIRGWGKRSSGNYRPFAPDPNYYHQFLKFNKIEAETEKSYLIDGVWIPKKICRNLCREFKHVFVHTNTLKEILATHKLRCQTA